MTALFISTFVLLALAALAFATWPVLRAARTAANAVLAAAIALAVLGIGSGVYLMVGAPEIALRSPELSASGDWKSIVTALVANARAHPNDATAWIMLGRGYRAVHDDQDAASAFKRALPLVPRAQQGAVLSSIGESLMRAAGGDVTPEAEAALTAAVKADPHEKTGRYLLGLAYARRHDTAHALAMWQGLLADLPADAPAHSMLVDDIAALTAQSGGAPDVNAMVAGLAARLKAQPNDPQGWQRLVRAYAMLGNRVKAEAALKDARAALKSDAHALATLDAQSKQLGLK